MNKQVEENQESDGEAGNRPSGRSLRNGGAIRKSASHDQTARRKARRSARKGNTAGGMHLRGDKKSGR